MNKNMDQARNNSYHLPLWYLLREGGLCLVPKILLVYNIHNTKNNINNFLPKVFGLSVLLPLK